MNHELNKQVAVYCASSTQIDDSYFRDARHLGQLMAEQNVTLINGAGNMGLMAESADGCLQKGGKAIGVIPTFMIEEGWCHNGMSEIIETADMHERQTKMAEMSNAGIFLPGGCGTFAELMELITWKQLGLYLKPIIILNTNGYFDSLLNTLYQAITQNFMRPVHADIWRVAPTPEEALKMALETPFWDTSIRRFAKI
ncbi:MAG: TIGR00730 family Rossman fold protein [Bacteroidaceae bacterium]|nr:TIGR00730 family Rossman fold protein [Bacteroidaceae bacterium]